MKKILFLSIFLIFNLGFSDLKDTIKNHYKNRIILVSKPKENNRKAATGGYIDGKWYAWYDNTFIGKEEVTTEKFHKFKSLEVEVVGMKFNYGDEDQYGDRNLDIYLKVSDFKLTDEYGNIYTPNNYPNEEKKKFIPNIVIDNRDLERYFEHYANDKNLKFIGSEKIDKSSKLVTLDTVPTKLTFLTRQYETVCASNDGKIIYLSCDINRK